MEKNIKSLMLRVRLDRADWTRLEQLAEEADMSMSELMRSLLHRTRIVNRSDAHARERTLNRINANLNMIAKWVNTYKSNADTNEVVSALLVIERKISEISK